MCLAIPGKVVSIEPGSDEIFRIGTVSFDGINRNVNLAMVPEVKVNDYVLVHVGVAIQVLDEAEAMKTMEYYTTNLVILITHGGICSQQSQTCCKHKS